MGRWTRLLVALAIVSFPVMGSPSASFAEGAMGELTSFSPYAGMGGIEPVDPGFRLASPEIDMEFSMADRALEITYSADLLLVGDRLPDIENWVFWPAEWVTEVTVGGESVPIGKGAEFPGTQAFHTMSLPLSQTVPRVTGGSILLVIRTKMEFQEDAADEEARRYGVMVDLQGRTNELDPLCVPGSAWDLRITVPEGLSAISIGKKTEVSSEEAGTVTFRWRTPTQRSSSNFFVIVGPYSRTRLDLPGDIGLWLLEEDLPRKDRLVEIVTAVLRKADEVMCGRMGLPPLEVLEIVRSSSPDRKVSGRAPGGLVLIDYGREIAYSEDLFTQTLSHEMCHQWFPGRAPVSFLDSLWLSESMATFYDARYLREEWPPDTYFSDLKGFEPSSYSISDVASDIAKVPWKVKAQVGYLKGAWVVNMLRETVGDEAFKTIVRRFYEPGVIGASLMGTREFRMIAEAESGLDLGAFFQQWLDTAKNPKIVLDGVTVDRTSSGWLVKGTVRNEVPMPLPPITVGIVKDGILLQTVRVALPGSPGPISGPVSEGGNELTAQGIGAPASQEAPFEILSPSLLSHVALDPNFEILNVSESGRVVSLLGVWVMQPLIAGVIFAIAFGAALTVRALIMKQIRPPGRGETMRSRE